MKLTLTFYKDSSSDGMKIGITKYRRHFILKYQLCTKMGEIVNCIYPEGESFRRGESIALLIVQAMKEIKEYT